MKILMVCLGNVCRSPLAEGVLKHMATDAGLQWTIESAGTNGFFIDAPPHPSSIKIALQNGIDICTQRSRLFRADDFDRFDKIYAMAQDVVEEIKVIAKSKFDKSKVDLLLNELDPGQNISIPDPWDGPEEGYQYAFERIDKACEKIIKKYGIGNEE